MSATRMMILGVIQWMGPAHGYDIRRELLSWSADRWANIQPGSVYHALRSLAGDGLLEEVDSGQAAGRPARTTYRITDRGRVEFANLLRSFWWDMRQVPDPFAAAFAFLPALPRDEAAAALRNRARELRAASERLRTLADSDWIKASKPVQVGWMMELWITRADGESAWCDRIADLIDSGVPYLPAGQAPAGSGPDEGGRRSADA